MPYHSFTVEQLMLDESFAGYCLKRDIHDIEKWKAIILSHPGSEAVFNEAEHLVLLLHSGLSEREIEEGLQQIQTKIRQRQYAAESETGNTQYADSDVLPKRNILRNKWVYIGAAASLLICVFLFFGNDKGKSVANASHPVMLVASSPAGVHKKVFLADGTEVYLNGNSSVSWDETYNKNDRQISLTGSAFFKVAKNADKPFTVHSGDVSTTALGTAFYVQQLPLESDVQVSLMEGKIDVEQKGNNTQNIVFPGEEILYTASSHSIQKQTFNTSALQHWLKGELLFSGMKLKDAVREISFWYNTDIRLQNTAIANKFITGTYRDASLEDVMKVMSFSFGFTYTTSGNTILIH